VITGPNGVGKTNILEAIYVLMQGKSFRDSDDLLMRYDQEWWKVVADLGDIQREMRYQVGILPTKQLVVGDKKNRFTYRQQIPLVLFEPDDLLMIHGSPGARRKHLDNILQLIEPDYRRILTRYERALLQRNNILKRRPSLHNAADAVFAWDIVLAEYGATIMNKRANLVEAINTGLSDYYREISGGQEKVDIVYRPTVEPNSYSLAAQLTRKLENDLMRGSTSVGPHRDDTEYYIDTKTAKNTASRGEVRSLVLALKLFELDYIGSNRGDTPLFLLDDVFSELDKRRQNAVISFKQVQTIITSVAISNTKAHRIEL
ncbi:DNA replication and repair protein RecF, partial [Candidatus Saccharibacteria bacterium]|nr:DNA replication and repair protein RecF [Candidatus Saccharibacteria bacterium]